MAWEPNMGPVQEQKVLLTPEPFLQLRILAAPSNPQPSFLFFIKVIAIHIIILTILLLQARFIICIKQTPTPSCYWEFPEFQFPVIC